MEAESIELSVVIPVFNEVKNIKEVVEHTSQVLSSSPLDSYEIIVVDDGSSDKPELVLGELRNEINSLTFIQHSKNLGLGAALSSGLAISKGDYWTFLPGDGEVTAEESLKLYKSIQSCDYALGFRSPATESYRRVRSRLRELVSWLNIALIRVLLSIPFKGDEGIYLTKTSFLKSLPLRSSTGLFNLETMYWAQKKQIKTNRVPIEIKPRLSGYSKVMNIKGILRQLFDTFKLGVFLRVSKL